MQLQIDLIEPRRVRKSDPATSHEAASKVERFALFAMASEMLPLDEKES